VPVYDSVPPSLFVWIPLAVPLAVIGVVLMLLPPPAAGARMPLPTVGLRLRCSTRFVPPRVRMVLALLSTGTVEAAGRPPVTLFAAKVMPASAAADVALISWPMIFCDALIGYDAVA